MRSLYIIGVTLAALLAAAIVANIGDDEQESGVRERKLSVLRFLRRIAGR